VKYLWLIFLSFGCNDFLNTWDGYVIDQGDHYSHRDGMLPRLINLKDGRHLLFDASFSASCLYVPKNDDINKLYGFTDCNSLIHENSVRFGWRVNSDERIEIFAYYYVDSHLNYKSMGFTGPNMVNHYEIWAKDGTYWFRFNSEIFETLRVKNCVKGIRFRAFPYFGGNETAPHDMEIEILEYK